MDAQSVQERTGRMRVVAPPSARANNQKDVILCMSSSSESSSDEGPKDVTAASVTANIKGTESDCSNGSSVSSESARTYVDALKSKDQGSTATVRSAPREAVGSGGDAARNNTSPNNGSSNGNNSNYGRNTMSTNSGYHNVRNHHHGHHGHRGNYNSYPNHYSNNKGYMQPRHRGGNNDNAQNTYSNHQEKRRKNTHSKNTPPTAR